MMMMDLENGSAVEQHGCSAKKAHRRLPKFASKLLHDYWAEHHDYPSPQDKNELLRKIHAMGEDWYTRDNLSRWFYGKKALSKRVQDNVNPSTSAPSISQASPSGASVSGIGSGNTGGNIHYTPEIIVRLEALISTDPRPTPEHIKQWSIALGIDPEAIDVYIQIKHISFAPLHVSQVDRKPTLEELHASESQAAHLPTPSHSISPEPVHRRTMPITPGRQVDPHAFLLAAEKALPREQLRDIVDVLVDAGVVARENVAHLGRSAHVQRPSSGPEIVDADMQPVDVIPLGHTTSHQHAVTAEDMQPQRPPSHPLYEILQEVFRSDAPPLLPEAVPRSTAGFLQAFAAYDTELDDLLQAMHSPEHSFTT